jgi:AraC-like DNA-binding protein
MLVRLEEYELTAARPVHGGVVAHRGPTPLDADMHQPFEVGIVLTGQLDRHFEDMVMTVGPGEMWLCGAWEPHGWRVRAAGTRELVVLFLPSLLGDEVFDDLPWLTLFSVPPDQRPRVTTRQMREQALAIGNELAKELRERRSRWLSAVRFGILRLLFVVSRGWHPRGPAGRQAARAGSLARVMPAVRMVHASPAARLSVPEAAAACGLSVPQFSYVFRHALGLSFGKFRMRARLGYAAQLLLSSELPVEAIAQEAGFADASHLHHKFSKVYGATPGRYRTEGRLVRGSSALGSASP